MFTVKFIKGKKALLTRVFSTEKEAKDFIITEVPDYNCEYQIIDNTKNEIIDDGDLEGSNSINETIYDNMFPEGKESEEGFDVDDHLGIE